MKQAPRSTWAFWISISRAPATHIFLENPQQALHLSESERQATALLDLNYYLPCRVQDSAIAVIGLGRTADGDFLSSEDMELLESLASYIGIALQNARLYASLEEKISEYERLKEFNENIVESINVGILAVDLEDRIDSWNSQMEVMYALPRAEALDQPLSTDLSRGVDARVPARARASPAFTICTSSALRRAPARSRMANIAIAPLVSRDFKSVGRIILVDDITRPHRARSAAFTGGEALLHRPACRRRCARSQHSARGHLVLYADAHQAGARR